MSYGPRPKDGNYSVRQLSRFFSVSKEHAAEAIAKRPGQPQRQISYAYRKSQETDRRNCATPKIKVTSTSNLIIDGKDSGQKSMMFYSESHAFDALNIQNHKDWLNVMMAIEFKNRSEYRDQHTLKTYIFEKILCGA